MQSSWKRQVFVSLHACQNCNVTAEFVDTYTDASTHSFAGGCCRGSDLVEDLVQEVFIAAWEKLTVSEAPPLCGPGFWASRAIRSRITIAVLSNRRSFSSARQPKSCQ